MAEFEDPLAMLAKQHEKEKQLEEEKKKEEAVRNGKKKKSWEEENNPFASSSTTTTTTTTPSSSTPPTIPTTTKPPPRPKRKSTPKSTSKPTITTSPKSSNRKKERSSKKLESNAPIRLLPGETLMMHLQPQDVYFLSKKHKSTRTNIPGDLYATTYQMQFCPKVKLQIPTGYFNIPLTMIHRVVEQRSSNGSQTRLKIYSKDMRTMTLGFSTEIQRMKAFSTLSSLAFPNKIDFAFAFYYEIELKNDPRVLYDPSREYERLGVLLSSQSKNEVWKRCELNKEFQLCPTYPKHLLVPTKFNVDRDLLRVARFRSKQRLPAMTWAMRSATGPTMWRCSQPKTGFDFRGGNRCRENEDLLNRIRTSNRESESLLIADCRPRVSALANKGKGFGFEDASNYMNTTLEFLGIDNIHAIRSAYQRLQSCVQSHKPGDSLTWGKQVEDSNWLYYVRMVLQGAVRVARAMLVEKKSVLIHCSDGWDRTSQICALSQLLMDPYYRTFDGFLVSIQKDWLCYGHKFHRRVGQGSADYSDDQRSPIFIQYLDCVWQLTRMYPLYFEFNESLLVAIAHHLYSCRFGTFLFNNPREREHAKLDTKTTCLFTYLSSKRSSFMNAYYEKLRSPLLPHTTVVCRGVRLWESYFCRWSPLPSLPTQKAYPVSKSVPSMYSSASQIIERKSKRLVSRYKQAKRELMLMRAEMEKMKKQMLNNKNSTIGDTSSPRVKIDVPPKVEEEEKREENVKTPRSMTTTPTPSMSDVEDTDDDDDDDDDGNSRSSSPSKHEDVEDLLRNDVVKEDND